MTFHLRDYETADLYDHLKYVWDKARKVFGTEGDSECDFQETPGRINLLAARGFVREKMEPVATNKNTVWDDTLFVIYIDPSDNTTKRVDRYDISTEHRPGKTALLATGMHKYRINFHHYSLPASDYVNIKDHTAYPGLGGKKYRALKPLTGVEVIRDADGDLTRSTLANGNPENLEASNASINIHFGGQSDSGPGNWSDGCQVMRGYTNYRTFIERVESDHSIKGTIDNLWAKPTTDGTRPVIYTLVDGSFLRPPAVDHPVRGRTSKQLYDLNERGNAGFFPVAKNGLWHGGVHLDERAGEPVRAVADGKVVAHRIDEEPLKVTLAGKEYEYSSSFALVAHEAETPKGQKIKFFSLYMHLLPYARWTNTEKARGHILYGTRKFVVATDEDGNGLNLWNAGATKSSKLTVIPKHAHVTLVGGGAVTAGDWPTGTNWIRVSYDGHTGYAWRPGNFSAVTGSTDELRCITTEDPPLDAATKGLNVRAGQSGTQVLRIIPKGEEIQFVHPEAVAPGGTVAAGWHEVVGGGFAYVTSRSISCEDTVEPDTFGKVVGCDVPIMQGEILGYPGPYFTRPSTFHYEILMGDATILDNPEKDSGGRRTLEIEKGAEVQTRAAASNPAIAVNLPPGSQLEEIEGGGTHRKVKCIVIRGWMLRGTHGWSKPFYTLATALTELHHSADASSATVSINAPVGTQMRYVTQSGSWRQVDFEVPVADQAALTGWVEASLLGDASPHTLGSALAQMLTHDPATAYTFGPKVGTAPRKVFVDVPSDPGSDELCKDAEGHVWQQVELEPGKRGWLQHDAPQVKVRDAYEWPRWNRIEESGKFTKDRLCDVPSLIGTVDTDGDGLATQEEIKAALKDPLVAERLRYLICKHPTEWEGTNYFDRLQDEPWALTNDELEATKSYVNKLLFWNDASDASLPAPDAVWSPHPVSFVEHLKGLLKGGTRISR